MVTCLILMVRLYMSCTTSGLSTFSDLKMSWLNLSCWGKFSCTHSTLFLSLLPTGTHSCGRVTVCYECNYLGSTLVRSCSSWKLTRPSPSSAVVSRDPTRNTTG